MAKGTISVADLLATTNNASAADIGEDDVLQAFEDSLEAHNQLINELVDGLTERTTDQLRGAGALERMTMQEVDEFGTARAQKVTAGANLGFPLKLKGLSVQWTRTSLKNQTAREMATQLRAAEEADLREVIADVKRAIYTPTNSSFTDRLVNGIVIPVKAFANADGFPLPVGPNGETFDSATEDHYIGEASLTAAFLSAAINTVAKKYARNDIAVYVNQAQEAAVRALAGFIAYVDARVRISANVDTIPAPSLDNNDRNDRAIGYFDGAEVLVKNTLALPNYLVIHNRAARKPLAFRERSPGSGNLALAFEDELHPLRARGIEREYGIAVQERGAMAVLYILNATYAAPTIAA